MTLDIVPTSVHTTLHGASSGLAPLRSVLVTGGGGFLGVAIVRRLLRRGITVTSLARRLSPALQDLGVRQVQADIADLKAVRAAMLGVDAVFHTAAKAGVYGPYAAFHAANVVGTANIVAACKAESVRFLVHTSSPSVVFDGRDQNGIDETAAISERFLAAYPATKALAERLALDADAGAQLRTCALRPHLIWGPGDPHLVPRVIALAKAGKLRLVGDGKCLVDAVYIDNAADAHLLALDALRSDSRAALVRGRAFFVTNHEPWPMQDILNGILHAAGMPPESRKIPAALANVLGVLLETMHHLLRRAEEPRMTRFVARQLATAHWYDPKEQRERLGYVPQISMVAGFAALGQALASGGDRMSNVPEQA